MDQNIKKKCKISKYINFLSCPTFTQQPNISFPKIKTQTPEPWSNLINQTNQKGM